MAGQNTEIKESAGRANQRFLTALHIPADIIITVSQHLQQRFTCAARAGVDLLPEPRTSPGPVPGRDARRTSHDVRYDRTCPGFLHADRVLRRTLLASEYARGRSAFSPLQSVSSRTSSSLDLPPESPPALPSHGQGLGRRHAIFPGASGSAPCSREPGQIGRVQWRGGSPVARHSLIRESASSSPPRLIRHRARDSTDSSTFLPTCPGKFHQHRRMPAVAPLAWTSPPDNSAMWPRSP